MEFRPCEHTYEQDKGRKIIPITLSDDLSARLDRRIPDHMQAEYIADLIEFALADRECGQAKDMADEIEARR